MSAQERGKDVAGSDADAGHAPVISVVVPTFQRREHVLRLLRALSEQQLSPQVFEVVVAVDGLNDGTRAAAERLALPFALRVVEQQKRGVSAVRNLGAAVCRGEILIFLDDDMEPLPTLLSAHLAAHAADSMAITIGPIPIAVSASTSELERYRAAIFSARLQRLTQRQAEPRLIDTSMGNLAVRRRLFQAVGGFDETFRGYGLEDFELVRRLVAKGGRLRFVPDAAARQSYNKTLHELANDTESEGCNAVLFVQKHPDILPELEIGTWTGRSRRHRAILTALIRLTLRSRYVRQAIVALSVIMLRLRPPFLRRFLDHVFDYLYWLGVSQAPGGPGPALIAGQSMESALSTAGLDAPKRSAAPTDSDADRAD